jgi:serine/threonine protein kinase
VNEWKTRERKDGHITPAVDCWAAGVVMFILLTGRVPFDEDQVEAGRGGEAAEAAVKALEVQRAAEGRTTPSLLRGLLQGDPAMRLTAAEALGDSWLQMAEDVHTLKPPDTYEYAVRMSKLSCGLSRSKKIDSDYSTDDSTDTSEKENDTTPGSSGSCEAPRLQYTLV